MGFCYLDSIFGSGPIRVTAWLLWLIAKFLPHNVANRIDRSVCQEKGIGGDASQCTVPVFINLAFGHLLIAWIQLIFISSPFINIDEYDLKWIKRRFQYALLFVPLFILVVLFPRLDDFHITAVVQNLHTVLLRTLAFQLVLIAKPIRRQERYNGSWTIGTRAFLQRHFEGEENLIGPQDDDREREHAD